jgi:hypothetical protein
MRSIFLTFQIILLIIINPALARSPTARVGRSPKVWPKSDGRSGYPMNSRFRRSGLVAAVLVLVVVMGTARPASADLVLNLSGQIDEGFINGSVIFGGSFEIHAAFDSTPYVTQTGLGGYHVTGIEVVVDGTSYTESAPGGFVVGLFDSSSSESLQPYTTLLAQVGTSNSLEYGFDDASPSLDVTAATPTVFSGLSSFQGNHIVFSTSSGDTVILSSDPSAGISASITPEPGTIVLAVSALPVGLVVAWRRRKARIS